MAKTQALNRAQTRMRHAHRWAPTLATGGAAFWHHMLYCQSSALSTADAVLSCCSHLQC